ncbi:MAG TPA: TetR/AcrR family transcriptional regulator [Solirubrobacteraceae bacterium]|nr:TetR/AcrR family transcriptional regulator [Solirubrobacteraceae bacterium]
MAATLPTTVPKQERSAATRERLLDAAVDELVASGFSGLTTAAVSARAGVSRGAQQHHFPHRNTMLAQAVRQLARRQVAEAHEMLAAAPEGRARVEHALEGIFRAYSGRLFAASVELSLAARHDSDLQPVIREHERAVSRSLSDLDREIFPASVVSEADFPARWATALGAMRGIAMLRLLGHPAAAVDRQWAAAKRELLAPLLGE